MSFRLFGVQAPPSQSTDAGHSPVLLVLVPLYEGTTPISTLFIRERQRESKHLCTRAQYGCQQKTMSHRFRVDNGQYSLASLSMLESLLLFSTCSSFHEY